MATVTYLDTQSALGNMPNLFVENDNVPHIEEAYKAWRDTIDAIRRGEYD